MARGIGKVKVISTDAGERNAVGIGDEIRSLLSLAPRMQEQSEQK
jgi:hypothetical protein